MALPPRPLDQVLDAPRAEPLFFEGANTPEPTDNDDPQAGDDADGEGESEVDRPDLDGSEAGSPRQTRSSSRLRSTKPSIASKPKPQPKGKGKDKAKGKSRAGEPQLTPEVFIATVRLLMLVNALTPTKRS